MSDAGHTVLLTWEQLPDHYPHVDLDAFVAMPNHIHGIIILNDWTDTVGAGFKPAPTPGGRPHGLPEIIRALKTFSARSINESRQFTGLPVWQRNYYEHIIRNYKMLDAIRNYIEANPSQWASDSENPEYAR